LHAFNNLLVRGGPYSG